MEENTDTPMVTDMETNNPLTKKELIKMIARRYKLKFADVQKIIDTAFSLAGDALKEGKSIKIQNFASFMVKDMPPQNKYDAVHKKVIVVDAHKIIKFIPSPKIKPMET